MYDDGYFQIANCDYSHVCIEKMLQRNKDTRPYMKWDVMDVCDMKYKDASFDLIIDKSTMDCLLCGCFPYLKVAIMLSECQRLLKTGGKLVSISYGKPDARTKHFLRDHLGFSLKTFEIVNKI